MNDVAIAPERKRSGSLIVEMGGRWGVEPARLLETLKSTVFRTDRGISNEQMVGLLVVAKKYNLDPFTRELFAFPDAKGNIVPFISLDGWVKLVNSHPMCDGFTVTFNEAENSATCVMYRKDRSHPVEITEYMSECARGTAPWKSHPRRMLRHKAFIQAARLAFGFSGVYDEDEAERIRDGEAPAHATHTEGAQRARVREVIRTTATHVDLPIVDEVPTRTPSDEVPQVMHPGEVTEPSALELLSMELESCETADQGAEVLDRARSVLPDDEFAALVGIFTSLFNEEPKE